MSGPLGPGSQAALRNANQQRVVALLQSFGELTQAQLAREAGLAPATVSNIVRQLTSTGSVVLADGPGRGRVVRLARAAGLAMGIDYGHRHITVAAADMSHQILAERRVVLGPSVSADQGLDQVVILFDQVLEEIGGFRSDVASVGMGLPAPINFRTGEVGALSILPGWVGANAAELASYRLGVPVVVDNDANLGALAEHTWGAGRGFDDVAYFKMSEGVGAGLIVEGKVFRGTDGTAGEIGHTTVDEFGAVCRCGNRGCLETMVAARSVIDLLEPRHGPGLTIARVVEMATAGDVASVRVLADTGRQAGVAVANLCNLFNPSRVVIGGELALAGDLLFAPMREMVRRCGIPSATARMEIVAAELGSRSGLLGAIALGLLDAVPHYMNATAAGSAD